MEEFKLAHKNCYRTHTCGELSINDVGEHVFLSGWVGAIRKLGGIAFVTIRDHYGVTQALFKDENMIDGITRESVVCVEGVVVERQSKNPKMKTGDIEIDAKKIKVLSLCKSVLPFEIDESQLTKEELRLKYRFLDLRNQENHERIVVRSNILHQIRCMMHDKGFTEIQTPILTSSSPEGARDFLVPSRLNKGNFFALPQAPQQFKQLLMISGFDKYFQIAPCFRDEDARADRSPGEFYQMDMEMAFATQEDVFKVIESVLFSIMKNNSNKEITAAPFERITYKESMLKYCTDKPDLRNPLLCHDVTNVFLNTEFNAFKNSSIFAICANAFDKPRSFFDDLTKFIIKNEGKGLAYVKVDEELSGSIVKFLSEQEKSDLIKLLKAKKGDVIFLVADQNKQKAIKLTGALRNELGERLELIDKNKFHFCWIVDFPFFEWNEDENKLDFSHNPFSMPQGGMNAILTKNPLDIVAYQYDLVLNGIELASGAVRNHEPDIMLKVFEMAGYEKEVVESKFPALYDAFSFGAPPHAGLAFAFDRVVMLLLDTNVIRDVIAFPLNKNAQDLMMGAPNKVDQKQLDELGLCLKEKK